MSFDCCVLVLFKIALYHILFDVLTGKSLHDACCLIKVQMMSMREVFWQNWSSNVVANLPQKWRAWLVNNIYLFELNIPQCLFRVRKYGVIFNCFFFHLFQVTDLTLARENQASFEEYLSNTPNANPGIDLTVTVLTTGFWPSYKSFDLNLPVEMVCIDPKSPSPIFGY